MAADFSAVLAFSTSPGSPPAIRYRSPPIVRNKVATPARMPTIHVVVLAITWAIEAAASTPPVLASAGGPAASTIAVRTAAARQLAAVRRRLPGGAAPRSGGRRRPGRDGLSLMGWDLLRRAEPISRGEGGPGAGRGAVPPFAGQRAERQRSATSGSGARGGVCRS